MIFLNLSIVHCQNVKYSFGQGYFLPAHEEAVLGVEGRLAASKITQFKLSHIFPRNFPF